MKLRRFLFAFLISLAAFQFCFSQKKPTAILFDEFEKATCEELLARLDAFLIDLTNNPNSKGYAVIYGKSNNLFEKLGYEQHIIGSLNFSGFDKNRLIVVRGKDVEKLKIEFWEVPASVEKPSFSEGKWNYILPDSTKPFVFTAYSLTDEICPSTSNIKLFADFLTANPNARGHLVFRDKTNKNFIKEKTEVLDKLIRQYKIPRSRLKLFYVKDKNYPYDFTDVEFWIVPGNKK